MNNRITVDTNFICQVAAANGLQLTAERAEALLPALQELLAVDAGIAALSLDTLTVVGLPWDAEEFDPDE